MPKGGPRSAGPFSHLTLHPPRAASAGASCHLTSVRHNACAPCACKRRIIAPLIGQISLATAAQHDIQATSIGRNEYARMKATVTATSSAQICHSATMQRCERQRLRRNRVNRKQLFLGRSQGTAVSRILQPFAVQGLCHPSFDTSGLRLRERYLPLGRTCKAPSRTAI